VTRARVLDSPLAVVDDLRRTQQPHRKDGATGFSPDFQVCLPYRGLFVWHVLNQDVVGDPNQVCSCRVVKSSTSASLRARATAS
jgi:hypothetical protein